MYTISAVAVLWEISGSNLGDVVIDPKLQHEGVSCAAFQFLYFHYGNKELALHVVDLPLRREVRAPSMGTGTYQSLKAFPPAH
jgi:hypothetical protein